MKTFEQMAEKYCESVTLDGDHSKALKAANNLLAKLSNGTNICKTRLSDDDHNKIEVVIKDSFYDCVVLQGNAEKTLLKTATAIYEEYYNGTEKGNAEYAGMAIESCLTEYFSPYAQSNKSIIDKAIAQFANNYGSIGVKSAKRCAVTDALKKI